MTRKLLENYTLVADGVSGKVSIYQDTKENVLIYDLVLPVLDVGTKALLQEVGERLSRETPVSVEEVSDPQKIRSLKQGFYGMALEELRKEFPTLSQELLDVFAGILLHTMYGL